MGERIKVCRQSTSRCGKVTCSSSCRDYSDIVIPKDGIVKESSLGSLG